MLWAIHSERGNGTAMPLVQQVQRYTNEYSQRKLGSNFRVTNDFLLGAIDYDEGW